MLSALHTMRWCSRIIPVVIKVNIVYRSLFFLRKKKECFELTDMDLLVHIGEVSGGYIGLSPHAVWRVNLDGELRDTYRKLTCVFEMEEQAFFEHYADTVRPACHAYFDTCWTKLKSTWAKVMADTLPFSNVWIAHETSLRIPANSVLFLGILNTLRTWNYFDIPDTVYGYSNTGGFGIDGYISSFVGASLVHLDKLYFCVAGDLSFFMI